MLDKLINDVETIKTDVEEGKYNGKNWVDGKTPNISIGTVTTLEPGAEAQVTQTGTIEEPVFNFALPSGEKGEAGGVSLEEVKAITGELENLTTEDKTNLVNAINEILNSSGGVITELTSTDIYLQELDYGVYRLTNATKIYRQPNHYQSVIKNSLLFVVINPLTNQKSGYVFGNNGKVSFINYIQANTIDFALLLERTNTTSYTPTSNYHPATKKYVDDSISNAITTVLEGEY